MERDGWMDVARLRGKGQPRVDAEKRGPSGEIAAAVQLAEIT